MKLTELLYYYDCDELVCVYKNGEVIFKGSTTELMLSRTPNYKVESISVQDNTLLVFVSDSQK